jgi:hypothetical protein
MPSGDRLTATPSRAASLWSALALGLAFASTAVASPAAAEDIEVVDTQGDVRVTHQGAESAAKPGTILLLPSTLATGANGAADLRQGATAMGVGPNTRLEFPAPAQAGGPSERVVQPRGTAFYTVARRSSKLRVETPYLVAVIKGTQFNVVVEPDASTISLYEGSLEVRATEGDAVVQLAAGEIATRRRGEDGIRVIRMKDGAVAAVKGSGNGPRKPDDGKAPTNADAAPIDTTGVGVDVDLDTGTVKPIDPVEGKVKVGVELEGLSQVAVGVDAGVTLGGASVETGVAADVDLAAGTVDATVEASVDAGAVSTEVGTDLGVDVAAGTIEAGVDAGVDAGPVTADVGADLGVDAAAGAVDAGVDLDTGVVDAGVDAGVDLGGSDAGVDLGVDLLGIEADVEIDLGGGESATSEGDDTGLLGTLRGRLGI